MEWKKIDGWPYLVSDEGLVQNARTGYILSGVKQGNGYLHVTLYHGIKDVGQYSIHSLVLNAFIGPRPEGKNANHKDLDKGNNRLSNLEYVTILENVQHAVAHGHVPSGLRNGAHTKPHCRPRHDHHGSTKLTWEQVRHIRATFTPGYGNRIGMARTYGITKSTLGKILNRQIWIEDPTSWVAQ